MTIFRSIKNDIVVKEFEHRKQLEQLLVLTNQKILSKTSHFVCVLVEYDIPSRKKGQESSILT